MADWGSYYGPGGASATYVSNMGSPTGWRGGGHGHGGGLSGQINALMGPLPDPNESLNALLGYAEQLRQRKRLEAERERKRAEYRGAFDERAAQMQRRGSPYEQLAQEEAAKAQVAQSRAASRPAPMRWVQPAGAVSGFYQPDESAMTGAQRQMFLPQDSQMVGAPIGTSPASPVQEFIMDLIRQESDPEKRQNLINLLAGQGKG